MTPGSHSAHARHHFFRLELERILKSLYLKGCGKGESSGSKWTQPGCDLSNARSTDLSRLAGDSCERLFLQLGFDGRRHTLSNKHLVLWLLVCGLLSPPKCKLLEGGAVFLTFPFPSQTVDAH